MLHKPNRKLAVFFRFVISLLVNSWDSIAKILPGKNSTVIVEGEVVNSGRALAVRGLVQTTGIYACGRCLDAVSVKVERIFCRKLCRGRH